MLDPDYIDDLFAPVGPVRVRRMFGGQGIHFGDQMIALVADGVLHMKADAETIPAFEAAGSRPFTYLAKGRPRVITSYWTIPESALDEPEEFRSWAEMAVDAARRAAAAKAAKPKRRKKVAVEGN